MQITTLDIYLNTRPTGTPVLDVSGSSFREGATIEMISGDHVQLSLYLRQISSAGALEPVEIPEGGNIVFAGRLIDHPDDKIFLTTDFALAGEGSSARYESNLDLNTTELNAALEHVQLGSALSVRCDVEIQNADNTRRRTIQFTATVRRQVYSGGEPPESAVPPYPLPGDLLTSAGLGSHTIEAGEHLTQIDLTSHALDAAPAHILLTLRAPSAESPLLWGQVVVLTSTTATVALSAPAPTAGYLIDYLIL